MSWTDERVETLKRMWAEGQSASQIAKELGGVTRNAVIGKVHRLGLSNRGSSDAAKAGEATPAPAPVAEAVVAEAPAAADPAAVNGVEPAATPAQPAPADTAAAVTPEAESFARDADQARPAGPGPRRAIIPAGQPLPPQPSANEVSPEALASVREVEKKARRLSLMELTERTCKWPIGDPATDNFWFCGLPVQQGKPYCEAHVGLAFQPMSSRRDRRR